MTMSERIAAAGRIRTYEVEREERKAPTKKQMKQYHRNRYHAKIGTLRSACVYYFIDNDKITAREKAEALHREDEIRKESH